MDYKEWLEKVNNSVVDWDGQPVHINHHHSKEWFEKGLTVEAAIKELQDAVKEAKNWQ